MLPTRLIINADDFGSGPGRNRGIVEAFTCGLVTEASLLANGAAFDDAVAQARAVKLPLGAHLNLADGSALAGPIPGLTDPKGSFPGKHAARRAIQSGTLDLRGVRRELQAQLERVIATGLRPSHLDSHQHWALFPGLTPLLLDLACDYGIPALRLPAPMEPAAEDPPGTLGMELALYRQLAPAMGAAVKARSLLTPMGLYGMPLLGRLDGPRLLERLATLPPGTWELMVHPGYIDQQDAFGGPARETELRALTAPEAAREIKRRGIELITFADLRCDC